MAKKSKVAKDKRQRELVARYAALRKELKEKGDYESLNKLPKNSSPTQVEKPMRTDGKTKRVYAKI